MKTRYKSVMLGILVLPVGLIAQPSRSIGDYEYRPFSVSFLMPLSTNGMDWARVRSNFSFNLIGGGLGRLDGVELGGVFNLEKGDVTGYQASGAVNLVGGTFTGVQQAGAANIVGGDFNVAQFAGGFNFVGGTLSGCQFGSVNVAGIVNGAQFGTVNISNLHAGAQFGTVNIGNQMDGFQLAVTNIAESMRGFQLGLVNIADRLEGDALGLVSIIGNGRHNVALWYDESAPVNIGVKLGSRHIYNVFLLGFRPGGDRPTWLTGLGLGGSIPLGRFFIDIDALGCDVRRVPWWEYSAVGVLSRLRVSGGWRILPGLALTAGPSLNLYVSQEFQDPELPTHGAYFFRRRSGGTFLSAWPGFLVGLQLLR